MTDTVDVETWKRWQADRPSDVVEWSRQSNGSVRIVWKGVRVRDSHDDQNERTLSIYYRWWEKFDPFAVPPADHHRIASGHLVDEEYAARHGRVNREIWQSSFVWRNLKSNLALNELADPFVLSQLDVHYRFLSAYTHPASRQALELPYPRNVQAPIVDHFSEEMVLLYVAFLAAEELRAFHKMAERPPAVGIQDWPEIEELCKVALHLTEHAWFPGMRPYSYDRVVEANQRAFDEVAANDAAGRLSVRPTIVRPETLPEESIRYYANPLRRLFELHRGFHEVTTGLAWSSPWQRPDAAHR